MKNLAYALGGVILIGLLCIVGYYGALRQFAKFKADMAFFSAVLPWLAGTMAAIAIVVVICTLSIAARDRWVAWRKS